MRRAALVLALALVGACVSSEERPPSGEEALARACDHVREAFAHRVLGDGSVVPENVVKKVTPYEVVWAPVAEPAKERRLFWADVEDVQAQRQDEKPARPESVYLYLARGSRSVATAEPVRPDFSSTEVIRTYVMLRERADGTRGRLARALDLFARQRARAVAAARPGAGSQPGAPPKTTPPKTATEPTTAPVTSLTVEERLQRLKDLHDRGLIDDEVYKEEQRRALSGF